MTNEGLELLEQAAGCENSEKLTYLADAIDLAEERWHETPPARPEDLASIKIKAIAEKFNDEPELPFGTIKKFRDYEVERRGITTTVQEWEEKRAQKEARQGFKETLQKTAASS